MEFRVFRKPEPPPVDDGPKPFGKRLVAPKPQVGRRLTAGGAAKAVLFGVGLGVLGVLVAPAL